MARNLESNPGGENAAVLHAVAHPMWETYTALKFSVEEGFPLDWMYPHMEPHGLIMKLNREPLKQFSTEAVKRDQEF